MKLQFDANLDFQQEAIRSITGIFEGQETCQTNFSVSIITDRSADHLRFGDKTQGVGNRLKLLKEDILENIKKIQLKNGLKPSEMTKTGGLDLNFTVEMETGTGKTYVYLRSVLELNRLYGFTKFIIVVPSIAIKEGVHKSLKITEEHFKVIYENVQFDYFVYDSQKLSQVRNFATSDSVQIMIINIDAFRKSFTDPEKEDKSNIIHRPHDRMNGSRPIDFIRETHPIVIIDEPQSVDTTQKSKEAIASLNPLCTLRYSATHVDKYHMLYKLDSIDAYEKKLVKQIEVAGIEVEGGHNRAYIKLLSVSNKNGSFTARIELDVQQKGGKVKRTTVTVKPGQDLLETSGGRDIYDGYIVDDIYCETGKEYISFTSRDDIIYLNHAIGQVDQDDYKRLQIRKTIEEHLEKELRLKPQGIKVLSLFFIDKVANYRWYDDEGNPQKGKLALMFEEEFLKAIQKPRYADLLDGATPEVEVLKIHDGYFAIDKKKDSTGKNLLKESTGEGKAQADESAYQLIMRDKEKLLRFDSKLKFIFSHSALREGWDSPNVFQICTLNETTSTMKKRQEIGRGLRLAVNQEGERIHGFEVNTLTVMANESYEKFAEQLQKEIEEEEGIRFGVVEDHSFAGIPIPKEDGSISYLGIESSKALWDHLKQQEYIDEKGKIQDKLKTDLDQGKLEIPEAFKDQLEQISSILKKVAGNLNVKNKDDQRKVSVKRAILESEQFKALWERVKYKTTFRVNFDTNKLIEECADAIRGIPVGKARFHYRKARTEIDRGGVHMEQIADQDTVYEAKDYQLPDLITYLQNETNLTRKTIVSILVKSGEISKFKRNPQKFIERVSELIKHKMQTFIVDGIKYQKLGNDHYYAQELFEENELFGYLSKNMQASSKSVYDYVIYDSETEAKFAASFEINENVKVYAKLPGWFKIDTPLGTYNPDWAVVVEMEGEDRLYFVVETKGNTQNLRDTEKAKIKCGKEHFKALGNGISFAVTDSCKDFRDSITSGN